MICFTINGIYKEMGNSLLDSELWLGFSRTFVLKPKAKGLGIFGNTTEYRICNEEMIIFNLTITQIKSGFSMKQPKNDDETGDQMLEDEQEMLIKLFQELSNMKHSWSLRFKLILLIFILF